MGLIKLTLTEDICKLIACIQHEKKEIKLKEDDDRKQITYAIDINSLFGGDYVLEDIAFILEKQDQVIEGTEEDPIGPSYPKELEDYMWDLYHTIFNNLQNIEEIVHQFAFKGGVTPGTYICKDWQHYWERKKE